ASEAARSHADLEELLDGPAAHAEVHEVRVRPRLEMACPGTDPVRVRLVRVLRRPAGHEPVWVRAKQVAVHVLTVRGLVLGLPEVVGILVALRIDGGRVHRDEHHPVAARFNGGPHELDIGSGDALGIGRARDEVSLLLAEDPRRYFTLSLPRASPPSGISSPAHCCGTGPK